MADKGINLIADADVIDAIIDPIEKVGDVTHVSKYLVAADGRKFLFDEAIWCTQV